VNEKRLLILDSVVDIILGLLLLLFPIKLAHFLGLPIPDSAFYPSILGGVLIGIGLALLIDIFNKRPHLNGLGIRGAIVINLCGAGTLMFWMIFGNLEIPPQGRIFLWFVAILIFLIGILEWAHWNKQDGK